jgi:pimeloyl-ACP methyl ester carboxylesterase
VPDQPLQVARRGLREYVDALHAEVARQHFDRPPILIGHSMGALLAQQLAARVQPLALVLLTPAPPWGVNGLRWSNVVAFAPWMFGGLFWRNAYKPGFERARVSLFNGVPADRHRALYEALVHESGRATAEIAFWWADVARAAAVRSDEVRCPVYVVSCGQDRLTPAAVVRAAVARYPQAAQRHYPERGHWVIDDEETEEMMHAICGWLRPIEQRHDKAQRRSA